MAKIYYIKVECYKIHYLEIKADDEAQAKDLARTMVQGGASKPEESGISRIVVEETKDA